jgi:hypothetical protein
LKDSESLLRCPLSLHSEPWQKKLIWESTRENGKKGFWCHIIILIKLIWERKPPEDKRSEAPLNSTPHISWILFAEKEDDLGDYSSKIY